MGLKRLHTGSPAEPSPPDASASGHPDAPPASRRRLAGWAGLPSWMGTRRASGPPAPRAASFDSLPADVLGQIAHRLTQGPGAEVGRNLVRASLASKALRAAVAGACDGQARRHIQQGPAVQKARALAHALARDLGPNIRAAGLGLWRPALHLLSRTQQAQWAQAAVQRANLHQDLHWDDIGQTTLHHRFKQFVPHLAVLDATVRADIVSQALDQPDDAHVAMAIGGLGGGLAHLEAASISRLLDRGLSLPEGPGQAQALRDLSAGLAHMQPDQRQRLCEAALHMHQASHEGTVLQGLCAQLAHVPPPWRDPLFSRAMALADAAHPAHPLAGLARGLPGLDEHATEAVLSKALGLSHPECHERAICALASRLESLDAGQARRLAEAVLRLAPARAVMALGPGLGRLPADLQDRVLHAAAGLAGADKAGALRALAAGLPAQAPGRHDQVAAILLGMDSTDWHTPGAIGALWPHLQHMHLDDGRRDALLDQALRALDHVARDPSRPQIETLTRGLGAGLGALREDQRQGLVTAVARLSSRIPQTHHPYGRLMAAAQAIAGLASGGLHLSTRQFDELLEAADQLQQACRNAERSRGLMQRSSLHIAAVAYFGLAAMQPTDRAP